MRRFLASMAFPLVLLGCVCLLKAQPVGTFTQGAFSSGTCAGTYTGIGDLSLGNTIKFWGGLRAYSAATCGTPIANVCNSTGGTDQACADLSSSASTGALVPATIGGITCPGANCTVKTLYDQSGALNCTGAACNPTQATVANRPTLDANCLNTSKPCMNWAGTAAARLVASSLTTISTAPTMNAVAQRNSGFTSWQAMIASNGGNADGLYFQNTTGNGGVQSSATFLAHAASNSALHSILGTVASGANNSLIAVDNSETTGTLTGTLTFNTDITIGGDSFSQALNGYIAETAVWSGSMTGAERTSVCHNQFGYWATAASC